MKKLYHSIGEVSKLTGVQAHVLRYWETLFHELSPAKNRAGKRVYKESDIQIILQLKELIQEKKYSTAGARKVLGKQKGSRQKDTKSSEGLPVELTRDLNYMKVFLTDLLKKI